MSVPLDAARQLRIEPLKLEENTPYPHAMSIVITPPWPQKGTWAIRSPETIGSNFGVLFIDHKVPGMEPVTLPRHPLRWVEKPGGIWKYDCALDYGINFGVEYQPGVDDITIRASITNRFQHDIENVGTQFCLMHTQVDDFIDRWAERTYILYKGEFIQMRHTRPGNPQGERPFFIVTNTSNIPPIEKGEIPRSWFADEQADIPLIATVSRDGKRLIGLAFDNAYKIMVNCDIPCIHADPKFADLKRGETSSVRGKIYLLENSSLDELLKRFYQDFPDWRK